MASAAEQLARNLNWGNLGKATELKKRLWFTLGALIVYRIGSYIPVPGVDPAALADVFQRQAGGLAGLLDVFSGGSIGRMSIFALSIMPYISASIIMQILTTVVPSLEALKKEGEAGRKKINQYTRYGTVILAAIQAYGMLEWVDADARYHRALIYLHTGNVPPAEAQGDSILRSQPGHLFGYIVKGTIARFQNDEKALPRIYADFLKHYDAERAAKRPEYEEHPRAVEEFLKAAQAGGKGTTP